MILTGPCTTFFLALMLVSGINANLACFKNNPYCQYASQQGQLICGGFDSFSKVDVSCSDLNNQQIGILALIPSKNLILDSTLDLSKVNYAYQALAVTNVLGFELTNNPLLKLNPKKSIYLFLNTTFNFYLNGKPAEDKDCTLANYGPSIFSKFQGMVFQSGNMFPKPLCPYVFHKMAVAKLQMPNLVYPNLMTFSEPADQGQVEVTFQQVSYANMSGYLDMDVLSPYVFGATQSISFETCEIDDIADATFQNLPNLKSLAFVGFDFPGMMKTNVTGWLQHLNDKVTLTKFDKDAVQKEMFILDFQGNPALISDDDFCNYKDFPHEKLVMGLFTDFPSAPTCNCALMFLIFHARFMKSQLSKTTIYKCLNDANFYANLKACDFDAKIAKCDADSAKNSVTGSAATTTTPAAVSNVTAAAAGNGTSGGSSANVTGSAGETTTAAPSATTKTRLNYMQYFTDMQAFESAGGGSSSGGSGSGSGSGSSGSGSGSSGSGSGSGSSGSGSGSGSSGSGSGSGSSGGHNSASQTQNNFFFYSLFALFSIARML